MKDGPNFALIAALIGDPARAEILSQLMDGRALTVGELAMSANVGRPTASAHLAKLEAAGLVLSVRQGRNRYVRLSGADVAHTVESLMLLAERTGHRRIRTGPRDPALREARSCYGHLAGAKGIQMLNSLHQRDFILRQDDRLHLRDEGRNFLTGFGISPDLLSADAACVACLDWSERKDHLAGRLGSACLDRILALRWARRDTNSRAIQFNPKGLREFDSAFPFTPHLNR
ncbi:ArsR/SmtB family transcription factor [Sphingomonas sp. R1]|uniref:ArsR/SmtB family transcription factor n=1 Tax=Sphingomonas sp. R1 TaxID=399176 RepID=UPI0022259FFD|nr:helix-turn-helix transcriptional regulator [Sphingomonas sp. R1]UYY76836.1 ArsR family transcriptional regulator [Sphingomonas sp. R1]